MSYADPKDKARWMKENRWRYEASGDPLKLPEKARKLIKEIIEENENGADLLEEELEQINKAAKSDRKFVEKYPEYAGDGK